MESKRKNTTKRLYGRPFFSGLVYRFTTGLFGFLMVVFWRARVKNLECVPKEEPFLLLPNHSSMLDPFWVGVPVRRGVRAMASAGLLRIPVLGAFLKMCGCFPKMKYTRDKGAMENMQRYYDEGYAILIFPEGNRCWNGETQVIGPGIGRLIKRMQCPVVYARLNTAYLVKPRWAKYSRRIPIEIEYDGPYTYDAEMSVEALTAEVQNNLRVVPQLSEPAKVKGKKMAVGLSQYLWACPACFVLESLKVQKANKNAVLCSACAAEWEIDVFCKLRGHSEISVADAFRAIESHYTVPPAEDAAVLEASGVALEAAFAEVLFIPRGAKPEVIASGRLVLHRDGLRVVDESDEVLWSSSLAELRGISIEVANMLHFRMGEELFRVKVPGHSPLKWDYFLRKWRLHLLGSER
jgi:1-acyl-sn-glycerol-3-phosphate acyltransferase